MIEKVIVRFINPDIAPEEHENTGEVLCIAAVLVSLNVGDTYIDRKGQSWRVIDKEFDGKSNYYINVSKK